MRQNIIPFRLCVGNVRVFSYAKAAKLPPSFPAAVTTHSLCYRNYKWRRNFANIQMGGRKYCKLLSYNEKGEKVFPGSFIFFLREICKRVASKPISKQTPDVLKSSKPPTELSCELSSTPGHPIWCCCRAAMVNWLLHSFGLNITILLSGAILCFIALGFFCLVSRASTGKNQMSWVGTCCVHQAVSAAAHWPCSAHVLPFRGTASCGSHLLAERCQQLVFVRVFFQLLLKEKGMCVEGLSIQTLKKTSSSVVAHFGTF